MEAIYAIDSYNGLSKNNIIPWNSKKDLKFFYEKTKYNVVFMGKNTFFSLPENVRPLKNRLNIVLTSNPSAYSNTYANVIFTDDVNTPQQILENKSNYKEMFNYLSDNFKVFIIGGKSIYKQFIPLCNTIWVTKLKNDYLCDLQFDYSFQNYKEPKIIVEDDELTIFQYVNY